LMGLVPSFHRDVTVIVGKEETLSLLQASCSLFEGYLLSAELP